MEKLNPEKLHVEFRPGVTPTEPIIPRRYTLTHSDVSAELFLTVGPEYAYDKITKMRDEVLAEWRTVNGQYYLNVYCYVDGGEFSPSVSAIRNSVFVKELPLAMEAIRYGDRAFFITHPILGYSPIFINFSSTNPYLNRVEYWGRMNDYK
ncbi:MAG: staygreen family protein [Bacillota bacterium]|nr:staygreen family protein [Bacillota bacterium]